MGVGKVAGGVDLMGLDLAQQLDDDFDVLLRELALLDAARFVERQVEEVGVGVGVQTERAYGGARFGAADGALQIEQRTRAVSMFCSTTSSCTATLPEVS